MDNFVITAQKTEVVHTIMKIKSNHNLSYDELSTLFNVPVEKIKNYNEKEVVLEDIKAELRFSTELEAISLLNEISDDNRLKAYIDELYIKYHLNNTILSKLTGIEESNLAAFIKDPDAISIEMKYILCIKVIYLLFLFSNRHI